MDSIPKLYETDGTPFNEKTVHQKWSIPNIGFYWLIVEIDDVEDEAFGYANLNNEDMAEWGYISLAELKESGAILDENFTPKRFHDAKKEHDTTQCNEDNSQCQEMAFHTEEKSITRHVCKFHYSPTNGDNEILSKDPKDCIYGHGDKVQCDVEQEYGKCI